jgi:hypothetical protein
MSKGCTLKEAFVEKRLDQFQPGWRHGEDITADTKQKIRDYVFSTAPEEIKDDLECFTDYSIWHMAKKIRNRENLPAPKKSNKGKVSVSKPEVEKVSLCQPADVERPIEKLLKDLFGKLQQERPEEWEYIILSCVEAVKNC